MRTTLKPSLRTGEASERDRSPVHDGDGWTYVDHHSPRSAPSEISLSPPASPVSPRRHDQASLRPARPDTGPPRLEHKDAGLAALLASGHAYIPDASHRQVKASPSRRDSRQDQPRWMRSMHVADQGRLDGSDRFLPTPAADDGFCPTRWRDSLLQTGLSRVSSAQLVLNGNVGGIKSVPRVALDRFAWVYSLPSGPWDLQVNSNLTPPPEKLSLPRQSAHEWAGLVVMIYPTTAGDAVTLLFQGRGHVQRAAHNAFVAFMEAYSSLTAEQRQLIPLAGCLLAGAQPHKPATCTSTVESKLVLPASSTTPPSPAVHLPPAARPPCTDYQYFVHLQGRTVVTTIEACTVAPDGNLVTRAAAASTGLAASVLALAYDRMGNLRVQDGDIIPDFTDLYACTGIAVA